MIALYLLRVLMLMTLANTPSMSVHSPWISMQLSCNSSLAIGGIEGWLGAELGGGVPFALVGGASCDGDCFSLVGWWS